MATTYTCGTAGRTYSTIQAAINAIPNPPTGGYIVECYNDSEFTAGFSVTGFTTSATDFIKVTTATGQSFMDAAGAATNPQIYDQSKGVGIRVASQGYQTSAISIDNDYVTVEKLQIKLDGGLESGIVSVTCTTNLSSVVRNCIGAINYTDAFDNSYCLYNKGGSVVNSLFYVTTATGGGISTGFFTGGNVIACAFLHLGTAANTAINDPFGGSGNCSIIDCTFFGFTTLNAGSNSSSYCATNAASGFTGSGNVYGLTFANEYVGTSDMRLKAGNSLGVGQRQNTYTNDQDIIGQARSTTSPYIGHWEYIVIGGGGGSTDYVTSRRGINGPGKTPNVFMAFTTRQRPQGSAPSLSYSYSASGGILFGGAATVIKARAVVASGGLTFSGTATRAKVHVVAASGGIQFGGSAAFAKGKTVTPSGGLQFGGTSSQIRIRTNAASGGLLFGGAATVSFSGTTSYSYTASGGMVLGGAASKAAARAVLAQGGLQFGGAATVAYHQSTRTVTPSGGLIFSGTGNAQFFTFGASNGSGTPLLRRRRW